MTHHRDTAPHDPQTRDPQPDPARPNGVRTLTAGKPRDAGFTLAETIVSMGIFLLLMVMVLTTTLAISRATNSTRDFTDLNAQARVVMDRLARELRQASEISAVTLPTATSNDVAATFGVDFNDNQVIDAVAGDPELLTYRYEAATERLTLTANDALGNALTRPILADEVTGFVLGFRSSMWQYDTNRDGITNWTELDATPGVGNNNGILDAPELKKIDLVAITLTLLDGTHRQTYETQVSLRNQAQN